MLEVHDLPVVEVDWEAWEPPLRRFADASGLVITAVDATGARRAGPFASGPLGRLLVQSALFDDEGPASQAERERLAALQEGRQLSGLFADLLRLSAMPIMQHDHVVGSVTFGWVLADFPSSLSCDRLADMCRIPRVALWQAARLEGPVSATRMATHGALLETMVGWGAQLVEAKEGLERLSVERDAFLARVSHELRTPLNAMSLRASMLERVAHDADAVRAHAEALQRSVVVESRLVEDLLEASVTRSGGFVLAPVRTDLAEVIRSACEQVGPMADARQVALVLDLDPASPAWLMADPVRLRQAIWNVVANAVKFSPEGGRVDVSLSATATALILRIADQGPGIAADVADRLFQPFARSHRGNAQGLGLGLAIARQIVELHGGRIVLDRTPGTGAHFVIELPSGPDAGSPLY